MQQCFLAPGCSTLSEAQGPWKFQLGFESAYLEGVSVGTDQALATFDKDFLVADLVADFDDITSLVIFQDLDGLGVSRDLSCFYLRQGHTARKKFDKVARLENDIRIDCLSGGFDSHATLLEIEHAVDPLHLSEK